MIHLYCGDGKGKTTAAVGLAVRAAGNGISVKFVQFMKNGSSGEQSILAVLPKVEVIGAGLSEKFTYQMDKKELELSREINGAILKNIFYGMDDAFELIILDEIVNAVEWELVDSDVLREMLTKWGKKKEIVITGRIPEPWMVEAADYVTDMEKIRHPYDKGAAARAGIEY